jgi:hypothetical protein
MVAIIRLSFEDFCKEHSVITACMPAHSSHILQPFNVSCFSPLKASYGKQVENQMRLGINHIDKEEFLLLYHRAHIEALSTKNIQNGFVATGLVPFNPERVLSTLHPIIRTPSPVPTEESIWESKTPKTLTEIGRQAKHIQDSVVHAQNNPIHHLIQPSSSCWKALNAWYKSVQSCRLRTPHSELKTTAKNASELNVVPRLQRVVPYLFVRARIWCMSESWRLNFRLKFDKVILVPPTIE